VYRPALEDGLLADINAAQMPFIHGHVGKCTYDGQMWQIKSPIGDVLTPLLIDARGRQAPNRGTAPSEDVIRGLPTIAINQAYFLSADQNSSPIDELTLIALEDGWAWLYPYDNQLYVQLTLHGKLTANGSDLQHKLDHAFARNPYTERIPTCYEPARAALCRGSTPRLFTRPAQCHYLRVGDAAMAVDPLSGNGIFQSLASALLIRPVVGTLLDPQGDSSLALRFYNERIRELFYRFARIGREFYTLIDESLETEMNAAFWRPRQHWPDHEPLIENDHEVIDIARRPIVDNKRIREDWVVVTRSNPLGIWRVNGRRAIDCVSEAVRRRFGVGKGY
jgi:flavin-dependent dehydrogenase